MQNDTELFAELIKNNPFWDIFDSQFEIIQPASSPELPVVPSPDNSIPLASYVIFTGCLLLGALVFLVNKIRHRMNTPDIFYDEGNNWYYYRFHSEDSSILVGDEPWLPKNYYFDIQNEGFFPLGSDPVAERRVPLDEIRQAMRPPGLHRVLPLFLVFLGLAGASYLYQRVVEENYQIYAQQIAQREIELSRFEPYAGMCRLNDKEALLPQLMTVQVIYDLPAGSVPPIAIETHQYLENDELNTSEGVLALPVIDFLYGSPGLIVGDSGDSIFFGDRATGNENCLQGNTFFLQTETDTAGEIAYQVPVDELKSLSLGPQSGSYESNLFGRYVMNHLINLSSYDMRVVEYRYSVDELPGCDTSRESQIYEPGHEGVWSGFQGEIVAWGTSPVQTIRTPDFQTCSSVFHLEYRQDDDL